jgi:tetratricopeptide (TPR) repeat protein
VNNSGKHIRIALAAGVALSALFIANRWKTSEQKPVESASAAAGEMPAMGQGQNLAPVDRIQFFTALFDKTKPPQDVARIILKDPKDNSSDSLKIALKWAEETGLQPLYTLIKSDLAEFHNQGSPIETARQFMFSGASEHDNTPVRNFLFQQGKKWIDKSFAIDSNSVALYNALIIYQSEYLNQPMAFLGTLRKAQAIDSNDVELNFIHLNLLKKSNQWEKAVKKSEKLISLQPQNPYWLFEASDMYGQMGDSVNAKVYLDLAIKQQRKTK